MDHKRARELAEQDAWMDSYLYGIDHTEVEIQKQIVWYENSEKGEQAY